MTGKNESDRGASDYPVGYGRPPMHSRFQPGQSGNPRGRPRGSKNFGSELDKQLSRKVKGKGGRSRTQFEQLVEALVDSAVAGNRRDVLQVFDLMLEHDTLPEPPTRAQLRARKENEARLSEFCQRLQLEREAQEAGLIPEGGYRYLYPPENVKASAPPKAEPAPQRTPQPVTSVAPAKPETPAQRRNRAARKHADNVWRQREFAQPQGKSPGERRREVYRAMDVKNNRKKIP